MTPRLRYAMASGPLAELLKGVVEVDETYVGGRRRIGPTNKADREKLAKGHPGPNDKKLTPVVALVERGGKTRAFPADRVDGRTLKETIRSRVDLSSDMMTDELHAYDGLSMDFKPHNTIKHSAKEYVRKGTNIHTNR
jgi:hypothetical protein